MQRVLRIHPLDNVAVAMEDLPAKQRLMIDGREYVTVDFIPRGHKLALGDIKAGENIIKYGCVVGHATQPVAPGAHVHTHNMATNLTEKCQYRYEPVAYTLPNTVPRSFMGYRRKDGRAAIRNEIWITPLVGCVNSTVEALAKRNQHLVNGGVEGIYAFAHPFGCSQMGDDHARTRKLLAALVNHPNAAGVLVVSLGCENNTLEGFQEELGQWDHQRVRFMVCQETDDEMETGDRLLAELAEYTRQFQRQPIGTGELVVGLKCGGSDGLSGVTANPAVGHFSDLLIAQGGSTVLTEVPEMFGAESLLLNRSRDRMVYDRAVQMLEDFKHYYTSHGQVVYENPSPGNKQGGITTLEDKSCGCVQKGGSAPVEDVLDYGQQVRCKGLTLLSGPGNDLVSTTALAAAGAHLVLFTTGRGTPFGAPVPTVKISSNTPLAQHKKNWIDFDAGTAVYGEPLASIGERLLEYVLQIASGQQTCTERNGFRGISILKDGVVL